MSAVLASDTSYQATTRISRQLISNQKDDNKYQAIIHIRIVYRLQKPNLYIKNIYNYLYFMLAMKA